MNENKKKIRKSSMILDGQVVETIYNQKEEKTQFAVYRDNQVELLDTIKNDNGDEFYPLDAKSDIVNKNVVLLPSIPLEYENEEKLIKDIKNYIHKYLDISPTYEQIASYYVLFSWIFDRFHEVPYLRAIGDFGSGKSRFLQAIGSICYRPIFTGGATTTAPIFRILDEIKGTLVLDEADMRFSDMTTDVVKILNMGYQKGGSVLRMQGKELLEIKAYDVFSPKIIATRETFSDKALESRFLTEEMGRGKLRNDIPRRLSDEFWNEALEIRNKLLMWRFRNYHKELIFDEAMIEGVHPRLHQIVIPLMTIIESKEMKESLKDFVQKYNVELIADRGLSRESDIAFAILKFENDTKKKEITVGEIAEYINQDIFDFEGKLTPRKIGWYLRSKMQLKPYKTRKGYVLNLERNKERLDFWKERYGITDEDIKGEDVNVVNDVNVVQEPLTGLTAEEVGF
jgi:predicted HTH domain antitoxin